MILQVIILIFMTEMSFSTVQNEIWDSGVPLGGIGVGAIQLMTDGSFGKVQINNNWDVPIEYDRDSFASVWVSEANKVRILRLKKAYSNETSIENTKFDGLFPRTEIEFTLISPN